MAGLLKGNMGTVRSQSLVEGGRGGGGGGGGSGIGTYGICAPCIWLSVCCTKSIKKK